MLLATTIFLTTSRLWNKAAPIGYIPKQQSSAKKLYYHLDVSGADLYSGRFNLTAKTVSDLKRLTATNEAAEFFPFDANWQNPQQFDFAAAVEKLAGKTGAISPGKILTATIVIGQTALNSPYLMNYETATIKPLLEMQNRGEIKIVTFQQLIDEWKTKCHSVRFDASTLPTGVYLSRLTTPANSHSQAMLL